VLFIFYGTNRTLKSNFAEGKLIYDSVSALATSLIGVILSIAALVAYSFAKVEKNILDHYLKRSCLVVNHL
jgi:hypothetical protein